MFQTQSRAGCRRWLLRWWSKLSRATSNAATATRSGTLTRAWPSAKAVANAKRGGHEAGNRGTKMSTICSCQGWRRWGWGCRARRCRCWRAWKSVCKPQPALEVGTIELHDECSSPSHFFATDEAEPHTDAALQTAREWDCLSMSTCYLPMPNKHRNDALGWCNFGWNKRIRYEKSSDWRRSIMFGFTRHSKYELRVTPGKGKL